MQSNKKYIRPYPTILKSIHLIVLYIFIQTVVDFPLAVWDYYNGTSFISNPIKRIVLSVGSIVLILIYAYKHSKTSLLNIFPVKKFNLLIFIPIIVFLLCMQIFIIPVNDYINSVIAPPSWFWELFENIFENKYGFWGVLFRVAIVAPIVEELIFRGVIMHGLMRNYPKIVAIFFSGLLFALFHLNPWQFSATFFIGCLLGWVMIITNNIFACILGHALNNLIVLLHIEYHQQLQNFKILDITPNIVLVISIVISIISLYGISIFESTHKDQIIDYRKYKPNYFDYDFTTDNSSSMKN